MDWEQWLRSAAVPPSDNEDSKRETTEDQIRDAIDNYEPLQGKLYRVYAKGSYANNTNVRLNYDMDIAVEYYGHFYFDFLFSAAESTPSDAGIIVPSSDTYTDAAFKADVLAALEQAFGKSAIAAGKIAYRVREKKTTLPADVVPCWEYRRYDQVINGVPVYKPGSRVYPSSGGYRDNFPELQRERGIAKNHPDRTGRRYKRMVRALKKLQTKLVADGPLDTELPSYFTECLVFNVPDSAFGHANYVDDMKTVLASIFNETMDVNSRGEWEHVHGQNYLFNGDFKKSDAHNMADVVWDAMGLG